MILFRSFAADHLDGISSSFSKTVTFEYPWFESSRAVERPNAPPPMMAIGSLFEMPIVAGVKKAVGRAKSMKQCELKRTKTVSSIYASILRSYQFVVSSDCGIITARTPRSPSKRHLQCGKHDHHKRAGLSIRDTDDANAMQPLFRSRHRVVDGTPKLGSCTLGQGSVVPSSHFETSQIIPGSSRWPRESARNHKPMTCILQDWTVNWVAPASSTAAEIPEAHVFMFDADIGSMESSERLPHSRAIARRRCSRKDPP